MSDYKLSKIEIATYLRDFCRFMPRAYFNKNVPFDELFTDYLKSENKMQFAIPDYYDEMISVYEYYLLFKLFTVFYDNYFDDLKEDKIDSLNIPKNIFVNESDYNKFSKKQIISYLRNALNHNDNINHDLLTFIRYYNEEKSSIKIEINLKRTKPIPFHIILSKEELAHIFLSILNANTFNAISYQAKEVVDLDSEKLYQDLDKVFVRKFYSKNKLTDSQIDNVNNLLLNHTTHGIESQLESNGLFYKDFHLLTSQKVRIEQEMKKLEIDGLDRGKILIHTIEKVMPLSIIKMKAVCMNLALLSYYSNRNSCLQEFFKDIDEMLISKKINPDLPFYNYVYVKMYGIDDGLKLDSIDFENFFAIASSIYYGFLFDSLITDEYINISGKKLVERKYLRDSFVHMRWFHGINDCYKLYDWNYGYNNEFNPEAKGFWTDNVRMQDMLYCSESYYSREYAKNSKSVNIPIHFRENNYNNWFISFIKNGKYYFLFLNSLNPKNYYELFVRDNDSLLRDASSEEIKEFINEIDSLSSKEKEDNKELLNNIVLYFNNVLGRGNLLK